MTVEQILKLPELTVPGFLLAGMEQRDGLQCAKVKSHENGILVLTVGGVDAQIKLESDTLFKSGVWLAFAPDGKVMSVEGNVAGLKPAKKIASQVRRQASGSGCNDMRPQRIF